MFGFINGKFRYDKIIFCIPRFFIIGDTFDSEGNVTHDYYDQIGDHKRVINLGVNE